MIYRLLLATLIALLAAPALAAAQTAEPVGTVSTGDDEVARAYDNPNVYFDALSGIMAFGQIHDDVQSATSAIRTTPAVFAASLSADLEDDADFTLGELEEVSIPQIGDQSAAHRLPFTMFGAFEGEYGMLLVRKDTWVQILLGFGVGEADTVADLQGIAQETLPRWPSDEPVAVREDGLRTGGIWSMMPQPEDLPDGFVLDEEFEEGPGPAVDTVVPVATEPADSQAQPTAEAEETPRGPSRDLLLPTPTPEDVTISESEATEPATPTPEDLTIPEATEPVMPATPVITNPRLATPFDVTVEIILPMTKAEVTEDGTCQGRGLLDGLAVGGTLTLRAANTGNAAATTTIAAPGTIVYDTELQQDICYFTATFTEVPPRSTYTLLAGESVLGRFTFEEVTAGDSLLVVLEDA